MEKEKRLIYRDHEKTPEGAQAEKPRNAIGEYLKLQGLATNKGLKLNERHDGDDTFYELANGQGIIVMHVHYSERDKTYTLVEHGDFGERKAGKSKKIEDLINLANQKLA